MKQAHLECYRIVAWVAETEKLGDLMSKGTYRFTISFIQLYIDAPETNGETQALGGQA